MRSAKSDKKMKMDILKYTIDPDSGEIFIEDESKTKIILEDYEGNTVMPAYTHAIGADVHRDFIQISVMVRQGTSVKEYHFQSDTDRNSLINAKNIAIQMIETLSDPHIEVDPDRLRYCCESTGNWHYPLLAAWGGRPIVVNPSIVKAGRRKSDYPMS